MMGAIRGDGLISYYSPPGGFQCLWKTQAHSSGFQANLGGLTTLIKLSCTASDQWPHLSTLW